jgi:two-component system phosphate regulon sensor histidine kinase PhoR
MLTLARLDPDSVRVEHGPVDLSALAAEVLGELAPQALARHIDLALADAPRATVTGDAALLGALLRNLVDNAIRYTRPGGRVDVSLRTEDSSVVLTVADTGVGIPSRDLPRVFERFYRVERARSRETGGTGLGLSIVKHVVENHGGTVSVESELGRGSAFEVRLPIGS